ncbi:aldo/keto reductase SKDI_03G0020 [Saccharomyces kudriavzevii IFO 1802]|uniref:NADP-dependent oxidoreductase domain-containing protein n=1 Tax=Saccharomyces kudriavzevii (strain ATCC MYA-4449 / AS 2.2408 / CBS 8840 / NBRC 1802 / NCYC 2889) TaxID=226230 RepID=A0AA35JDG5_SACK1|nr:uncharacterized protein SKDI_03G0020 [Saccharomyces kudriavzevii IFO 1802]CAI4056314.1 hypothetical protein SKDI_03G0020 [Saccharomyces kudriavzevii IFO 1802]
MSKSYPEPVKLGNSGLKISPILVGCMSYGSKDWAEWVINEKGKIFEILKHCYDGGMRTFDTADVYSNGLSERILGEFLKHYKIKRETVVILTKVYYPVDESLELTHFGKVSEFDMLGLVNQSGLSRKHILEAAKNSVERLGTYIDVLQIHKLDHDTPMEEIMKALNGVVELGYTRYIGASSMLATEFAELQFIAEKRDWTKFICSQSCYSLLYREDERELIPFAKKHGIGLIPWSPNARGILTRPLNQATDRKNSDPTFKRLKFDCLESHEKGIVNRVEELAKKKGISMAMVSIAWVLSKGACPIVGLNSIERVDEAIRAVNVQLTEEEIQYLEELYKPTYLKY